MTNYIFTGPTIQEEDARQWLEAVYLPPVSQGDIINLLQYKPQVIGIIDGYFDSVPAVWHKEILLSLSQGVTVVGGASMGALRAAELHTFGMIGVGEIFEWYRDGLIEADDEVAVQHAPAEFGYRPFNEALVNVRKTLQAAVAAGVIVQETAEKLIEIGRNLPYWQRTYPVLFRLGQGQGVPAAETARLEAFVAGEAVDLKRQDAVALLKYIAQPGLDSQTEVEAERPSFSLNETVFLGRLIDRDRQLNGFGEVPLTANDLVNYLRFEQAEFFELKARAVTNSLALDYARQLGLTVNETDIERETAAFKQKNKLERETAFEAWRQRNQLSLAEFENLMADLALIRKVRDIYDNLTSSRTLLRQLRLENQYETMLPAAREKAAVLQESYAPPDVSLKELIRVYFAEKGQAVPDDMNDYATQLGFRDYRAFILELEKSYHYHQQQLKTADSDYF